MHKNYLLSYLLIAYSSDGDGFSLMQLRGKGRPRLSLGRQDSIQQINLFTFAHDIIQYARLWIKTFSGLLWQDATKTMLANKDNIVQ